MAHHINVVLTEDMANLGKSGELVRVRPGYAVDRRRIQMEAIKNLGTHPITIRLATSVSATVEVTVAKKA